MNFSLLVSIPYYQSFEVTIWAQLMTNKVISNLLTFPMPLDCPTLLFEQTGHSQKECILYNYNI